jgi:hypothetical protein
LVSDGSKAMWIARRKELESVIKQVQGGKLHPGIYRIIPVAGVDNIVMALWRNPNPVLNTNWRAGKDFSGSQCTV